MSFDNQWHEVTDGLREAQHSWGDIMTVVGETQQKPCAQAALYRAPPEGARRCQLPANRDPDAVDLMKEFQQKRDES
jgi:hypothetical protein